MKQRENSVILSEAKDLKYNNCIHKEHKESNDKDKLP